MTTTYKRLIVLILFAALALAVTGCSAAAVEELTGQYLQRAGDMATKPAGKLLVQGTDGNIYTMDANGFGVVAITNDANNRTQYLQPTWSADSQRLAWSQALVTRTGTENSLITSLADGTNRAELSVPFAPFYINWSPNSSRLAYLSNWRQLDEGSMVLRVVEIDDSGATAALTAKTLAEGQPFYFSWAPDGERMLTHIGNERLELQSVDGSQEALVSSSGAFPAPQWAANGETLLYAVNNDGVQRLVLTGLDGEETAEITDYDDRITFTMSPDDSKLAYVVTTGAVSSAALGPLYVVDLETMGTRELSNTPVLAFFWSPDSRKLAYMATERIGGSLRLKWYVWDGERVTPYADFLPTRTFLQNYLAFFDQYAQSMQVWSPDSRAFAYAAISPGGRASIWVQSLGEGKDPDQISPGVYVAWSPR